MKYERKLITPAIATQMLQANTKNRNVRRAVVLRYYNDMVSDKWKEDTGEPIKISKTNTLLDGQHRLIALIKANKSFYFLVITDLEDEIFDVLDTGSIRSAGDVFNINGIKNANSLPAMIQHYESLKNGKSSSKTHINLRLTNAELLSAVGDRLEYWQTTFKKSMVWYNDFSHILSPQIIGGTYSYFYDINATDAADFFDQLCTGTSIENETINNLRNRLIADKIANVKKMPQSVKVALIIKTWNFYRSKVTAKVLKYAADAEKFPTAI